VLVVDDDANIRNLLRDALQDAGHRITEAPDGAAALARLNAGGVDLVLLDLMLPDLNGLEVCRQVRVAAHQLYLPIIMITALGAEKDLHTGFAAGADDYVTKPFSLTDVCDRVGVWVRMRERLRVAQAERLAETEAALLLAQTPLQVLLNLTRAWEAHTSATDLARVRTELEQSVQAITVQMEHLGDLLRSEEAP
jgi:two-component system OmpR family response regulator